MTNKQVGVDVSADVSGYRRGLEEAKRLTENFSNSIKSSGQAWSALGGVAVTAGRALAGGVLVAGAAAAAMTRNIILAADGMVDLSKKTGLAVEQIGAWKLAAEQSGTKIETVARGLKDLSKYMVEHGDNLRAIGIKAKTADEALVQFAGVISSLPVDDPRRMALSMEVLKKSGVELLPMLSEGEEGLRKMLERGKELNPITTKLAEESDRFNDQLAELKLQATAGAASVADKLLPAMNEILETMRDTAKESGLLMSLWAGLGSVASHAFGFHDMSKARDKLAEVKGELKQISDFLAGDKATVAHLDALIPRLKQLGIEKANLESVLSPGKGDGPKASAVSSDVIDKVLGNAEDKKGSKSGSKKTAKIANAWLDEARDLADLMKEVGRLNDAEKTHIDLLRDQVAAYSALDPEVKKYLETTIEQANQRERAKAFGDASQKLLEENQNLNAGLLASDQERIAAQLDLEHQRAVARINEMKIESEQAQALIAQETENYKLRIRESQQEITKTDDLSRRLGLSFTSAFENAISGGQKFGDVLKGLEQDIIKLAVRFAVTDPLMKGLETLAGGGKGGGIAGLLGGLAKGIGGFVGGMFGGGAGAGAGNMSITSGGNTAFVANGGWFDGNASYFASGGVVNRATPFLFANGGRLGVMGEAGPEAILPLKRGANGQLGVQAGGGGGGSVNVQVNLIESPGNGGKVERRQEEGGLTLDIMVEQIEGKMSKNISRGSGMAPTLEGIYGLNRAGATVR